MAHCYLLAIAGSSSLDKTTNIWSLFSLTERVQLLPSAPPIGSDFGLPLELHAYWHFDPTELGTTFEWRYVVTAGSQERPSSAFELATEKPRHRHRLRGFPVWIEGDTMITAEWRIDNGPWQRAAVAWPLTIERQQAVPPESQQVGA
jgi:hypothetical protein